MNNFENECKKICEKYNKPFKSIYSWNSYKKAALNNGFENVEDYFKDQIKKEKDEIIEEERREKLYKEYNLKYSKLSWSSRYNQVKLSKYYNTSLSEYDNMKIYLEGRKKEQEDYDNWYNSLPGNGNIVIKCTNCKKYFKSTGPYLCDICFNEIYILVKCSYSECNKEIYILKSEINQNHFCSTLHLNLNNNLVQKQKDICQCGNEIPEEYRNIIGLCQECRNKKAKENVNNNKKSGKCSICNIFNNERDQNGRGRDIIYGNGQKIKVEKINKNKKKIYNLGFIPILPKSYLIGCRCSYNWYYEHNNSDNMKNIERNNMEKRITEVQNCRTCGLLTHVDYFFYGYECGHHDEFYYQHNNEIYKNNFIEIQNKLKEINKDLFKNIKIFKNKKGFIIINNNKIYVNNIYKFIIKNKNLFNKDDKIEIIINENNDPNFKINYQLENNNIKIIQKENNKYPIINPNDFNNYKNISGVWFIHGTDIRDGKEYCLTGGQSINICSELNRSQRILANDKLQDLEIEKPGCTGRWDQIQKYYNNFYYVKVAENIEDFDEREIIEAIYATENNALYWRPSPTQNRKDFIKKIKEYLRGE